MGKKSNCLNLFIIGSLLFLLSLSGCVKETPIRIGITAQFTGKQADLGIHLRNGVELAVEEFNMVGGFNGRQVELLVEDDLGTPQGAKDAENKLIDKGVVAVIGHVTSDQTLAGYEVAEQRGVLLFSATAAASEMTGIKDLFYRIASSTDSMGHVFASYLYNDRKIDSIAIILDEDNKSFTESWANAFSETFQKLGGKINYTEKIFSSKSPDYSISVKKLKDSTANAVLIIASPYDTALIAQTINLQNWTPELFTTSWAQGDMLFQTGGKTIEGMEIIVFFNVNDKTSELEKFKKKYLERFNTEPVFTAMQGYETMQLLLTALQKTGGSSTNLGQELIGIQDYIGLNGSVQLDEYGDVVRDLTIQKIVDGKFEIIKKWRWSNNE
jgi:branched-chain amino acid transport system substrate-binding protein